MFGSIFRNSYQNQYYKMLILGEEILSIEDTVDQTLNVNHLFVCLIYSIDAMLNNFNIICIYFHFFLSVGDTL